MARLSRGCLGWALNALQQGDGDLEERGDHLERLIGDLPVWAGHTFQLCD